jgi:hypothetical protein
MDNHELVLELNEITALMVVSSVGIMLLLGMFLHLSFSAIFGKEPNN